MKNLASMALAALLLAAPAFADYDAAGEAREAAQRKAEQQESARRKAEAQRTQSDAMAKYQREAVGSAAKGKTDAEVKKLYDEMMKGYMGQAAEAQKKYGK